MVNIPSGGWLSQPAAQPYVPLLQANTPPGWTTDQFANLIGAESGFQNPTAQQNYAYPASHAAGMAQFEPATAAQYGVNPMDPNSAIPGASQLIQNQGLGPSSYNYTQAQLTTPGVSATPAYSDPFNTGMNDPYLSGAGESGNSAASNTGLPDQTGMGFADPYSQNSLNTFQDATGQPALYSGTPAEPGLGNDGLGASTSPLNPSNWLSGSSTGSSLSVLGTYAERGLIILLAVAIVGVGLWMFGAHGQAASLTSIANAIKGRK